MADREQLDYTGPSYRQPRASGLDPDIKRMGLVAAALAGAALLVIGMWSALGHHRGGVPVIAALPGPVRVKPADPGGMKLADEGDLGAADGADALAPAAETPAIDALARQTKSAQAAAPQAIPTGAADASGTDEDEDGAPATVATPPGASAAKQSDAAALAAALPAPVAQAPVLAAAPAAPLLLPTPPPVAAPTPAEAPAAASASSVARQEPKAGATQVQLAAMESEQAAFDEWARLDKRMPGLLGSRKPVVEKIALAGHMVYRLRTGGFADMAAATGFCEQVRSKGGECSIAAF